MKSKKLYEKKSYEDKKKEVDELIKSTEKRLEEYFISEESIKEYLKYMSNFYKYSLNNSMLIENQFNGAIAVGSYEFWKEKGYFVKKGEKGIKILVPIKSKPKFIRGKDLVEIEKATDDEKKKIKSGEIRKIQGTYFKIGNVFDISQTNAKASDLPEIFPNKWIEGDVENYEFLYKGMEEVAKNIGVNIVEPMFELGVSKGASLPLSKEIIVNPRNGQVENVKTLLHELAHAKLHNKDNRENYTINEREFQAEVVAYTIGEYFGIDSSDSSLNYIHSWTKGKTLTDKQKLLKEVRETSIEYIDIIENEVLKQLDKGLEKYEGLSYSSAREGIKIYNDIKKNEKEIALDMERKDKLYNENINVENNNSIDLTKAYRAYDSILEKSLDMYTSKENGFDIEL